MGKRRRDSSTPPTDEEVEKDRKRLKPDSSLDLIDDLASKGVGMRSRNDHRLSQTKNVQQVLHQWGYHQGHTPQGQPLGSDPQATSTSQVSAHGQFGDTRNPLTCP